MRQGFAIAWKVAIVIAIWLAIAWLTGYLRPLDASLGTELPAWVQRLHAHILLLLDDGLSVAKVQEVTFSKETDVANPVRQFREGGVAAVLQEG